ncbi:hypothetical protein DAT35_54935 [Vitiosangium sp. GDMCC 1.1324]|nr:hypothetical protein DAT35_54935 [Vitiosangium sp. GDMCC 1.1324]
MILARAPNRNEKVLWEYRCDCGKTGLVVTGELVRRDTPLRQCRSCSCLLRPKRMSLAEAMRRLQEIHGDVVTLDEATFVDGTTECDFIDADHGRFRGVPSQILFTRRRHPAYGNARKGQARRIPAAVIKEKIEALSGGYVTLLESSYRGLDEPAYLIDREAGRYRLRPNSFLRNPSRHPKVRKRLAATEAAKSILGRVEGALRVIDGPHSTRNARGISVRVYGCECLHCGTRVLRTLTTLRLHNKGCGCKKAEQARINGRKSDNRTKIIPLAEVLHRVSRKYGDQVRLVPETYSRISAPAVFIDQQYGPWETAPTTLLAGHLHPQRARTSQAAKRRTPISELQHRLNKAHRGLVSIDETTFINQLTHARFIDIEFGEWWALPASVLRGHGHWKRRTEKSRATSLQRFGVAHNMQRADLALKVVRSANRVYTLEHWRTGEAIVCMGSYEEKTVRWLNANKMDFQWQPGPFALPFPLFSTPAHGVTTYRPDLFLPGRGIYVEIKGRWMGDSLAKWEWFRSQHPAELWDGPTLRALGILAPKGRKSN